MFRFEGFPAERINTDAGVVTDLQVHITVCCDVTPGNFAYTHESLTATRRLHLQGKGKGKGKGHPRTDHEGPEEKRYSSTLSLTSALDGIGWSTPRPSFTPGKDPVPIV